MAKGSIHFYSTFLIRLILILCKQVHTIDSCWSSDEFSSCRIDSLFWCVGVKPTYGVSPSERLILGAPAQSEDSVKQNNLSVLLVEL